MEECAALLIVAYIHIRIQFMRLEIRMLTIYTQELSFVINIPDTQIIQSSNADVPSTKVVVQSYLKKEIRHIQTLECIFYLEFVIQNY